MVNMASGRVHRCVREASHSGVCVDLDGRALTTFEIPIELRASEAAAADWLHTTFNSGQ